MTRPTLPMARRQLRTQGWGSVAKLGVATAAGIAASRTDGPVMVLMVGFTVYFALMGAGTLLLTAYQALVLRTYRNPWV